MITIHLTPSQAVEVAEKQIEDKLLQLSNTIDSLEDSLDEARVERGFLSRMHNSIEQGDYDLDGHNFDQYVEVVEDDEDRPVRWAIVNGHKEDEIGNYLPSNYEAIQVGPGVLIQGRDSHGWTLEGYVIPRLGSGLIAAKEISCDVAMQVVKVAESYREEVLAGLAAEVNARAAVKDALANPVDPELGRG